MPGETAIRCLMAAAKYGSFTKAANELYMSRQAVSRQIRLLESELGSDLFYRTTAKVELTEAGKLYVEFFADVLMRWEEVRQKVKMIKDMSGQAIRIGYLYDAEMDLVYNILDECKNRGIDLSIRWERKEPHELVSALMDGQLDVSFSFKKALDDFEHRDALDCEIVMPVKSVIVVRDDYPLVKPGTIASDFQNEPLFIAQNMIRSPYGTDLLAFQKEWRDQGFYFTNVQIVSNRESLYTMVEAGQGITISTEIDRFPSRSHLVTYYLNSNMQICCIWRRHEKSHLIRKFIDVVLDVGKMKFS